MKSKKQLLCSFFTIIIFIVASITVYGGEYASDEDITLAPYFFIEDKNTEIDSFPLKETNVTTNINGVIADIYVVQTYVNEGSQPINANYIFPASTRASVHGMTMQIGDNIVTAQIKEREEAKKEYQRAKQSGKSAALLEQQRPNVFTMSIANIMPGDIVRVELHYTEMIISTEGVYQFVFPTVVGPRYSSPSVEKDYDTDKWVASPYLKESVVPSEKYNITVNLSTGVPITDLTCNSHKVDVVSESDSTAYITLSDPGEFAGNRDFILNYKLTGLEVASGLMIHEGENGKFFMLTVQPPERNETDEDMPPREYIFVLDESGSMSGYPLYTAKELIRNLVSHLRETDKFNLILFSDELYQISHRSVFATEKNLTYAISLIDQQFGGGGTEFIPALRRATAISMDENVSRSIIVITDGYILEEKEVFDIINANLQRTNFFSFGVGTAVNRYLIDGFAKAGLGESFVVTDPSEISRNANLFRTCIQHPLLTDINIAYNGFETYDVQPSVQPTLFTQKPIVIFGKWRGDLKGSIQISGKNGNNDYMQEIQLSEVMPQDTNSALPYLWARKKVETLIDYGYNRDSYEDLKKEVTAIGLKYSILTPYTSFVAVIDTVRNSEKKSTDVDQPIPLPLHVSNLAVGGYTIGSEPETIMLISCMTLALFISALLRRNRKMGCNNDL